MNNAGQADPADPLTAKAQPKSGDAKDAKSIILETRGCRIYRTSRHRQFAHPRRMKIPLAPGSPGERARVRGIF